MHDIKYIRENTELFRKQIAKRNIDISVVDRMIELDRLKRDCQTRQQELQSERNKIAKDIGMAKREGKDTTALENSSKKLNSDLAEFEDNFNKYNNELNDILVSIPNIPADDVPVGKDENDNVELKVYGSIPKFNFDVKAHYDLGENLDLMNFTKAAEISGARFVILKKNLAKLERALANFMLNHNIEEYGYTEVMPPFLVSDHSLFGTGNLPKFAADNFRTTDGYWLIPTAEVPLTNMVRDSIVDADELPLRFTAFTPCFRSEAGSAGRDTRGMIRLHQFSKVELVSITTADKSVEEHNRMLECSEKILQKLEIPYRVVTLCSGDMGFPATKTYDIEVWLPSQNCYREISSVSNCGDFQARRMKARYRKKGEKDTHHLHTLNGSALAVGRTIVAILENYQQADGSIAVPKVLQAFMNCDLL